MSYYVSIQDLAKERVVYLYEGHSAAKAEQALTQATQILEMLKSDAWLHFYTADMQGHRFYRNGAC